MNNLIKISTLLLATSSAFAGGVVLQPESSMTNGFYGGLGLGSVSHNVDENITGPFNIRENYGKTSVMGQVFVGYEKQFDSAYGLQLEAFINYSNNAIDIGAGIAENTYTIHSKGTYGIKVMPFYQVSDSARVFVDIGYASSKVSHDFSQRAQDLGLPSSNSKSVNGVVLGAGSEIMLSNQLSMRGEYQYISYSSWERTINDPTYGVLDVSHKPTASMFVASMVYRMA